MLVHVTWGNFHYFKKATDSSNAQPNRQTVNRCLTHWRQVTHICVSYLTIIGSDNGRHQAIKSEPILECYWWDPWEQTSMSQHINSSSWEYLHNFIFYMIYDSINHDEDNPHTSTQVSNTPCLQSTDDVTIDCWWRHNYQTIVMRLKWARKKWSLTG